MCTPCDYYYLFEYRYIYLKDVSKYIQINDGRREYDLFDIYRDLAPRGDPSGSLGTRLIEHT
jgi:hypothetical protein